MWDLHELEMRRIWQSNWLNHDIIVKTPCAISLWYSINFMNYMFMGILTSLISFLKWDLQAISGVSFTYAIIQKHWVILHLNLKFLYQHFVD